MKQQNSDDAARQRVNDERQRQLFLLRMDKERYEGYISGGCHKCRQLIEEIGELEAP
jgi:hypothetical protein